LIHGIFPFLYFLEATKKVGKGSITWIFAKEIAVIAAMGSTSSRGRTLRAHREVHLDKIPVGAQYPGSVFGTKEELVRECNDSCNKGRAGRIFFRIQRGSSSNRD
jgi:hypothetical protein